MNRPLRVLLFGSGLLALSVVANAQNGGQGPYYGDGRDRYSRPRDYYPDQGWYGNDRYSYGGNQDSLLRRVMADLNMVAAHARIDRHERKHFDEAARKLEEFEYRWARGKFDGGKLDKAIENLEHLADADQLRGRDRNILARDAQDLRQLRFTRGRYSNDGYGDYRDDWDRRYNPRWR